MDVSGVVISEWAQEQCRRWNVEPEELAQARVDGSVLFEESAIEVGRVVIWGPQRGDGSHLYIVCGPEQHIINDFRPLRKKPHHEHIPVPIWPV
jgi:hypothetical protein